MGKKIFAFLMFVPISMWIAFVFYFGSVTLAANKLPNLPKAYDSGYVVFWALAFHVTWCVFTASQAIFAFAISEEVFEEYVNRAIVKNRKVFYFLVVDIAFALYFCISFRHLLWP